MNDKTTLSEMLTRAGVYFKEITLSSGPGIEIEKTIEVDRGDMKVWTRFSFDSDGKLLGLDSEV